MGTMLTYAKKGQGMFGDARKENGALWWNEAHKFVRLQRQPPRTVVFDKLLWILTTWHDGSWLTSYCRPLLYRITSSDIATAMFES